MNNDLTSKLARKNGSDNVREFSSLANSIEFFTVYLFCVKGFKIGTRNLAML